MNSLYDILGLGRSATAEQVEQAYQTRINKLKNVDQSSDQDMIQLRAIKEAYAVLSSANRRAAYDSKLNAASRVTHEVVESAPLPWLKILLVAALFIGGGTYYYTSQAQKARLAQLALETEKAKAEADKVAKLAEIEAARLEHERVRDLQRAETNRRMESEQARHEGQRIHAQMEQLDTRIASEKAMNESRERSAQLSEEQAARSRVQQQNAAMQRALNIPVGSQGGSRTATIQPRPTDMRR